MHGVDGEQRARQALFGNELLDRGNFIGFFVTLDVGEDERQPRREGAENVSGLAILELVKAAAQCLAINGDVTMLCPRDVLMRAQGPGMLSEHALDANRIELQQDPADGRVSWGPPPFQAKKLAQPGQMFVDECVYGTV